MPWISQAFNIIVLFSTAHSKCLSQMYENTIFSGGDISKVYTPDAEHCQIVCTYHPRCLFFSFLPGDWPQTLARFACFLKDSDTSMLPKQTMERAVSGHSRKQCSRITACNKEIYEGLDLLGDSYNATTADSYEQCQKRCTNEDHCHFFTYTTALFHQTKLRQQCYLKYTSTGTPTQIKRLGGVVSGFSLKRCQLSERDCRMDIFQRQVFSGVTLAKVLTPDVYVCRTICTYHPNCLFFTFHTHEWEVSSERYTCVMMTSRSGTPDGFEEKENALSGFSLQNCRRATPACHYPTFSDLNFLGTELSVEYVNGHKSCQQLCTDTVRCQFFTYDSDQTRCNQEGKCKCYLRMSTNGCPHSIVSENGKVSGYTLRLCQTKVSPVCVQESSVSTRVVGGVNASLAEWPWQVSLHVKLSKQSHLCGGSIISDQWILTAAHCTEDLLLTEVWRVYSGILKQSEINKHTPVFKVQEIVVHPKYKVSEAGYDIALLKLDQPMNFSVLQQPLCLPTEEMNTKYTECWVTGWGFTKERGQIHDTLQKARIPLISNQECQVLYKGHRISDKMLCAGYTEGGTDACKGDSGGPLSCKYQNKWYLAGITSWGEGCARPGQPGVYTNVAEFVDWILEKTS
ncbi:plasma kallikrein isoform X5 [Sceloporus undulatus]|nr:plasma kallikrein isoform X5 [Sceloporus undulatus]XP_042324450.1 plasma kallikrein isoform X5 [Sceloporus undulatus]XP_042324451.1 plasma kallikrein isoform X5 [Sceloporus undulatus]